MKIVITYSKKTKDVEAQAEFDELYVIEDLAEIMEEIGHRRPLLLDVTKKSWVQSLIRHQPHLVFNLAEGVSGPSRESLVPAVAESLGLPYTGSDAATMALTLDKHATKASLHDLKLVSVPQSQFLTSAGQFCPKEFANTGTLLVKPNFEGSSKGVTERSVFSNQATEAVQRKRIGEVLSAYPDGVLVEKFVPGFDVTMAWINGCKDLLPVTYEAKFRNDNNIRTYQSKNEMGFEVELVPLPRMYDHWIKPLQAATKAIVQRLRVRDLARLDFRMNALEEPQFLEINPLPILHQKSSVFLAASWAGLTSLDVIDRIITSAMERCDP